MFFVESVPANHFRGAGRLHRRFCHYADEVIDIYETGSLVRKVPQNFHIICI